MAQLGELLKRTREEKGLTLDEVAHITHIRPEYLAALETNNFKIFPTPFPTRSTHRASGALTASLPQCLRRAFPRTLPTWHRR